MRLDVIGLTNGYAAHDVFTDISFTVKAGEILCILGPNGVGKTTLFKTLLGTLKPRRGDILLNGQNIVRWSRRKTAQHIGYVPQHHTPSFPYTVFDVVLMGRTPHLNDFAVPAKKDKEIALNAIESINIGYLANKNYSNISGGERQLVLIARALAQEPQLLIMDEPTANLDFGNQIKLLNLIKSLANMGKGIIISTHVPDHALRYATKVALMKKNQVFEFGLPHELLNEENLKEMYGIEIKIIKTNIKEDRCVKVCVPS